MAEAEEVADLVHHHGLEVHRPGGGGGDVPVGHPVLFGIKVEPPVGWGEGVRQRAQRPVEALPVAVVPAEEPDGDVGLDGGGVHLGEGQRGDLRPAGEGAGEDTPEDGIAGRHAGGAGDRVGEVRLVGRPLGTPGEVRVEAAAAHVGGAVDDVGDAAPRLSHEVHGGRVEETGGVEPEVALVGEDRLPQGLVEGVGEIAVGRPARVREVAEMAEVPLEVGEARPVLPQVAAGEVPEGLPRVRGSPAAAVE